MHKILNLKGIYAILSRIWKCRKSRILVLIFWVKKLVGANFLRFCNSAVPVKCSGSMMVCTGTWKSWCQDAQDNGRWVKNKVVAACLLTSGCDSLTWQAAGWGLPKHKTCSAEHKHHVIKTHIASLAQQRSWLMRREMKWSWTRMRKMDQVCFEEKAHVIGTYTNRRQHTS